jgi:hypothetical protein
VSFLKGLYAQQTTRQGQKMALLHIFTSPDLSFDLVIVSSANDRTRDSNLDSGFFPDAVLCS